MSALPPPINFRVNVNGLRMTASVIEEIIPPFHFIFRVRFSNGFEDLFYLGDGGVRGEGEDAAPYAQAISMDMDHVVGMDPNKFYHIFEENIDGVDTNVWIITRESESRISYAIYYNRFYRFELTRNGDQWEASTAAKIFPNINFKLARKVGLLLDSLL